MDTLIVPCTSCGAKNRKTLGKLGDEAICAKCAKPLPRGGGPVDVTTAEFDAAMKASRVPVLVDFWANWCPPCKAFAPVLHKYAENEADRVLVLKVDTDAQAVLAERYDIRAIPTTILFHGGTELSRQSGAMPAATLDTWVKEKTRRT